MDTEGNWCLIYREHCWLWAPGSLFPPLLHPTPSPGWPWEAVIELWLFLSACHGLASHVESSCFSFISSVSSCGMGGSSNGAVDWLRVAGVMLVVCCWVWTTCICSWCLDGHKKQQQALPQGCTWLSELDKTRVWGQYVWPTAGSVAMSASLHLSYLDCEVRIQSSSWRITKWKGHSCHHHLKILLPWGRRCVHEGLIPFAACFPGNICPFSTETTKLKLSSCCSFSGKKWRWSAEVFWRSPVFG